jgi:hypothetical protein
MGRGELVEYADAEAQFTWRFRNASFILTAFSGILRGQHMEHSNCGGEAAARAMVEAEPLFCGRIRCDKSR